MTNEFIHKLKTSPDYHAQGEALKREFLQHMESEDYYGIVWNDIKQRIVADLAHERSVLRAHAAEAIFKLASGLRADHALQARLNAWLLQAIIGVL